PNLTGVCSPPEHVAYSEDAKGTATKLAGFTIDRFAALPTDQLATTRQIPSFGYSRKTWWLRSELPGTWFAGEPRWMQLGPSFVDHLTIYYRPL
ncbi:hypothetical protein K4G86_22100, partial [Mycobacterium tuberculosis]|nr:hypothetical protein [Mycobacterium tuberculosis]